MVDKPEISRHELVRESVSRIKSDEGWRARVYDDATGEPLKSGDKVIGTPTIGYGFTRLKREAGDLVVAMEVDDIINHYFPLLLEEIGHLNVPRMVVYVSMIYNLGWAGFCDFKKMRAAVREEDWDEAAKQILDSKAGRSSLPGLRKRYQWLARVMRKGEL